jgi:cytosine/adenosine deaminase-related metal-dependent hydrolase
VNPTGDLAGAVQVIQRIAADFTHDDLVNRATRAALRYLAAGTTAVRTHADLGEPRRRQGRPAGLRDRGAGCTRRPSRTTR